MMKCVIPTANYGPILELVSTEDTKKNKLIYEEIQQIITNKMLEYAIDFEKIWCKDKEK